MQKSIEIQCSEEGIYNTDKIKKTLKTIVVDQSMKLFDFLPQSKKVQMTNEIQGMFGYSAFFV